MTKADDLLRQAQKALEASDDHYELQDSIEEFLDAPKDEPVAWQGLKMHEVVSLWSEALDPAYFARAIEQALKEKNSPPTKTAPKQPMTDEEIHEEFGGWATDFMEGVFAGVRFAERHHGIGGGE